MSLKFVLLDDIGDFHGPSDPFCGDCGRRVHAGIRQLDDNDPVYYSVCPSCGMTSETPPDDYHEEFYHHFPEQKEEEK